MLDFKPEYHGSPAQKALMQRAEPLWHLVKDDPRFGCHGRDVQLSDHTGDNLELQIALTRMQGAAACCGVPKVVAAQRRAGLESAGFVVDEYEEWRGGAASLVAAERVISARELPTDIQVHQVNASTPPEVMEAIDAITQSCGVLLPNGAFVRGQRREGVCLYASTENGDVVATAASVTQFHPSHPRGGEAWWGMLATKEDRRGQGLAIILGAMTLIAMEQQYGVRKFFTGIREGNVSSERLCAGLGLVRADCMDMIAVDTSLIPEGRTTK
ncbi:MAG: GNAT family N-acetyltransferase [Pikeienuella sp.]